MMCRHHPFRPGSRLDRGQLRKGCGTVSRCKRRAAAAADACAIGHSRAAPACGSGQAGPSPCRPEPAARSPRGRAPVAPARSDGVGPSALDEGPIRVDASGERSDRRAPRGGVERACPIASAWSRLP